MKRGFLLGRAARPASSATELARTCNATESTDTKCTATEHRVLCLMASHLAFLTDEGHVLCLCRDQERKESRVFLVKASYVHVRNAVWADVETPIRTLIRQQEPRTRPRIMHYALNVWKNVAFVCLNFWKTATRRDVRPATCTWGVTEHASDIDEQLKEIRDKVTWLCTFIECKIGRQFHCYARHVAGFGTYKEEYEQAAAEIDHNQRLLAVFRAQ
jgi:hypothetical protein